MTPPPITTENPYTIEMNPDEALIMHDIIEGTVIGINRENKTVDVILDEPYYPRTSDSEYGVLQKTNKYEYVGSDPVTELSGVKVIYNCQNEQENPAVVFSEGDRVLISTTNNEYFCIGFPDEIRLCGEYVLIALDGYAILWNLTTDSYAEIEGVIFPCLSSNPNFQEFLSRLNKSGTEIFTSEDRTVYNNLNTSRVVDCCPFDDCWNHSCKETCETLQEHNSDVAEIYNCTVAQYSDCLGGTCAPGSSGDTHCSFQQNLDADIFRHRFYGNMFGNNVVLALAYITNENCYSCYAVEIYDYHCDSIGTASIIWGTEYSVGNYILMDDFIPSSYFLHSKAFYDFTEEIQYRDELYYKADAEYDPKEGTLWSKVIRASGSYNDFHAIIVAVNAQITVSVDASDPYNPIYTYNDYESKAVVFTGYSESGNLSSIDIFSYKKHEMLSSAVVDLINSARTGLDPQDVSKPDVLTVELYK